MSTIENSRPQNNGRGNAYPLYVLLEGASAFIFQLPLTYYTLYYATAAGLDALQIMVIAAVFEMTIFLCEVPTGIAADVYSRRRSVLIGIGFLGVAFLLEGMFPVFAVILLAQVVGGMGATFISGAAEAWITDEIGIERANQAFVRAAQFRTLGSMAGIVVSVLMANVWFNLPFVAAGVLFLTLTFFLTRTMPETGFRRTAPDDRRTWRVMLDTLRSGLRLVRLRRVLFFILLTEVLFAAHSEGFDNLWQKHILDSYELSPSDALLWVGIIGMSANVLSLVLQEWVRRRVNLNQHTTTVRALGLVYLALIVGILIFGTAGSVPLAVIAGGSVMALRSIAAPLSKAWLNQTLAPEIRATMFSVYGQLGSLGETAIGPAAGAVGKTFSVRATLIMSAAILLLTLPFFLLTLHQRQPDNPSDAKIAPIETA